MSVGINSVKKIATVKKNKIKQCNIAIVLDESGSMAPLMAMVKASIDNNFNQIAKEAKDSKIPTKISLFTFNDKVTQHVNAENVQDISSLDTSTYYPEGYTALYDGIIQAIDRLQDESSSNHSNLVIIITDGEENVSKYTAHAILDSIKKCLKEGNWDFAVAGPATIWNSPIAQISALKDSITVWEGTAQSINRLTTANNTGLTAKYASMRSGQSMMKGGFYAPQVANLTKTEIKSTLNNVTSRFHRINVRHAGEMSISSVVTRAGHRFVVGSGYYQLTKKETVQDYKNIIVQNNATNELFSGTQDEVRELLSLPTGGTIELNPAFSDKFTIFVRSTSWNRKLIPGTVLLYSK